MISLNIANLQIHGRTFANKFFRLCLMYFLFVRCGFFGKVREGFLSDEHTDTGYQFPKLDKC